MARVTFLILSRKLLTHKLSAAGGRDLGCAAPRAITATISATNCGLQIALTEQSYGDDV
jgi:hypothetical protein